jgi:hypothetical protein
MSGLPSRQHRGPSAGLELRKVDAEAAGQLLLAADRYQPRYHGRGSLRGAKKISFLVVRICAAVALGLVTVRVPSRARGSGSPPP